MFDEQKSLFFVVKKKIFQGRVFHCSLLRKTFEIALSVLLVQSIVKELYIAKPDITIYVLKHSWLLLIPVETLK